MLDEAKVRAVLQKVRAIEVRTRKVMNEGISGSWRSHFKGRGMNFEELRDYTPGDEIRTIDWNSTAKLNRPVVKVFREDRELIFILVLDVSASDECGSVGQSKREFASEIASVLALSALKNNDKVGLFLFSLLCALFRVGFGIDHFRLVRGAGGHSRSLILQTATYANRSRRLFEIVATDAEKEGDHLLFIGFSADANG